MYKGGFGYYFRVVEVQQIHEVRKDFSEATVTSDKVDLCGGGGGRPLIFRITKALSERH